MQYQNLKLIVSLNFLPISLSKLSRAFDVPLSKGYFPHFFNTKNDQNYTGQLPPIYVTVLII